MRLPSNFCQFDSLLPALNLQKYSSPPAVPLQRLDPHAAQLMYQSSLCQAQIRVSNAWETATVQRREKTMQELHTWLSHLPAAWGKSLLNCTPADVIAFLEDSWLVKHAGTTLDDGSLVCSPSGVNTCCASLSRGFEQLGRVASWVPETPSGNPIHSSLISSWRRGYKLQIWRAGYLAGSAVPMTEGKAHALVDYIDSLMANSEPMTRLMLERDALLALVMWETPLRGNDCGKLTIKDFFYQDGSVLQLPLKSFQQGTVLTLRPNGTKTVKCQRSGPFSLSVGNDSCHSFLSRLPSYIQRRAESGFLAPYHLFSPLAADRRCFKTSPMSASDVGKRLRQHLEHAGLYAGESNHGFRRGQMQSMANTGANSAEIGQRVQIKTAAIVDRYLDTCRHLPRLDRLANNKRSFADI